MLEVSYLRPLVLRFDYYHDPCIFNSILLDGHKFLPMLERTVLKRDKLHIRGLLKFRLLQSARYISGELPLMRSLLAVWPLSDIV